MSRMQRGSGMQRDGICVLRCAFWCSPQVVYLHCYYPQKNCELEIAGSRKADATQTQYLPPLFRNKKTTHSGRSPCGMLPPSESKLRCYRAEGTRDMGPLWGLMREADRKHHPSIAQIKQTLLPFQCRGNRRLKQCMLSQFQRSKPLPPAPQVGRRQTVFFTSDQAICHLMFGCCPMREELNGTRKGV